MTWHPFIIKKRAIGGVSKMRWGFWYTISGSWGNHCWVFGQNWQFQPKNKSMKQCLIWKRRWTAWGFWNIKRQVVGGFSNSWWMFGTQYLIIKYRIVEFLVNKYIPNNLPIHTSAEWYDRKRYRGTHAYFGDRLLKGWPTHDEGLVYTRAG